MNVEAFKREMEQRYGSDEAIGLFFELDEDGSIITLDDLNKMLETVPVEKLPGMQSRLPDGGSGVCCTDYAAYIFKTLPGRVQIWGFANEDNPSALISIEEWHPGGHDFAVVDERFIVDPWPRLVPCTMEDMVFDLADEDDAKRALEIYGPKTAWERMETAEIFAKLQTEAENNVGAGRAFKP